MKPANFASRSSMKPAASAFRFFLVAIAALGLAVVACGGGSGGANERLFDIEATANTCLPLEGRSSRILVLPGEKIRFRVYNRTNEMMEFIVTDEAGEELRHEKLQPSFRIVDPVEAALGGSGEFAAGEFAAADFAHEGHEDEAGPDATEDYKYRMLVQPQSVRNMLITFPEIAEGYVLNRAICADPNSLTQVVVTEIARR